MLQVQVLIMTLISIVSRFVIHKTNHTYFCTFIGLMTYSGNFAQTDRQTDRQTERYATFVIQRNDNYPKNHISKKTYPHQFVLMPKIFIITAFVDDEDISCKMDQKQQQSSA